MNVNVTLSKTLLTLFCGIALCSCKNTGDDTPPMLQMVMPKQVFAENDTVSISLLYGTEQVTASQWSTSAGTIDPTGTWIVPVHIDADTSLATVTAWYQNRQTAASVKITKRAFSKPLVSFAQTIQPLLVNNCNFSGCHANGSRAGKVELSIYDSVTKNLLPYNADGSKLYVSLIKTDPLRIMPPAGKLHASSIQSVWLWIEQGARNN